MNRSRFSASWAVCIPGDLATIVPAVQRAHDPAGDGLFDVERRIIRRDGQLRWLATRSITVFGGEGAQRRPVCTVGAVGAVVDITERKLAEPALHEERNFTNAVLSNAGALVLVLDREGRIRRFNRAAEQASGRSLSPARAVNGLNMRSSSPRGMTCGHRPTPATVTSIDEDHDRAARAC